MSCGCFSRNARWPSQGLGPGFYFASNLRSPLTAVGRDLESDPRTLDAPALSDLGEQRSDDSRKSSDIAAEKAGKHLSLAIIRAVVDEDTGGALDLSRPEIAFPSCHADEAHTVDIDVAVMAMLDVPEQHPLAKAVVRGLGEGAGTRDGATAIVEPVSRDVPAGNLSHEDFHLP